MLDDAIMTYKEAIAREPNFPEAYNNLVRPPPTLAAPFWGQLQPCMLWNWWPAPRHCNMFCPVTLASACQRSLGGVLLLI
jgi:hypothetical protein